MSVGRICTRVVATASGDETVREAARRMVEYDVGTLPVVDGAGLPVGIITDRDITVRCVAPGRDPEDTRISEVMTPDVRTVNEAVPIEEALRTMAGARTRRLVVTAQEGKLAGILSMDDVMELISEEAESIGRILAR